MHRITKFLHIKSFTGGLISMAIVFIEHIAKLTFRDKPPVNLKGLVDGYNKTYETCIVYNAVDKTPYERYSVIYLSKKHIWSNCIRLYTILEKACNQFQLYNRRKFSNKIVYVYDYERYNVLYKCILCGTRCKESDTVFSRMINSGNYCYCYCEEL